VRSTEPGAAATFEWTVVGVEMSDPEGSDKHAVVAHDGVLFHDPARRTHTCSGMPTPTAEPAGSSKTAYGSTRRSTTYRRRCM
jgi:hypothetical protein